MHGRWYYEQFHTLLLGSDGLLTSKPVTHSDHVNNFNATTVGICTSTFHIVRNTAEMECYAKFCVSLPVLQVLALCIFLLLYRICTLIKLHYLRAEPIKKTAYLLVVMFGMSACDMYIYLVTFVT